MESIDQRVAAFIQATFPESADGEIDEDRSLLDAGLIDSIGVLTIVTWIEETFGVMVDDEDVVPENLESIASIAQFIERKLPDADPAPVEQGM